MAESLRDLVVSLSLNTDNFTRNIKSVNKQIQEAESYFKLAAAGVKGFDTSAAGLASKLEMLQRKLTLQKDAVGQYERALTAASSKLTECYNRQQDYARRLEDAKTRQDALREEVERAARAYEEYKNTLGESDSATIAAKANLEAAEQEYADVTAEVTKLAGQNDALKRSTQNAADAVSTAQTQLNKAKGAVRETEAALRDTSKELQIARSRWTEAGKSLSEFSEKCEKVAKNTEKIGRVMTATLTTPIVGLGATAMKASIEFESAFTGVRKTVSASEAEFAHLEQAVKQMSTEIAADTTEIANVMAVAGQLGIETSALEDFTRVMIDLGNTTDIVSTEAGSTLAKFANIMDMDQSLFQNLGSTLVDLGNNYATTESAIMEMSLRLAGAGKQIGLSEAQILGFATALSSVGIEAQMGGSALSKALIKMEVAAATGGQALTDFAGVCGMTEEQFVQIWNADPAAVFQSFIEGLARMDDEGISAIAVLQEIGIAEIRLRDTMLRAVNSTELFANTQETANRAWAENTALTREAGLRYSTTQSQLINLKNKAMLFAQTLGDDMSPALEKLMGGISGYIDKLMDMDEVQRMTLIKNAMIVASIGPAALAFSKLTKGIGLVSKGLGLFSTAVGKAGGGFKGFMSVLGKSPAVWAAVAIAVVAGTAALIDYASGAKKAREALEGMQQTAEDWKNTAADTFYGRSNGGLSFFGMSASDFQTAADSTAKSGSEWLSGLIAVWTDGKKETNAIVKDWTESFKAGTTEIRDALKDMKVSADENGYTSLSQQMQADLDTMDSVDAEIARLLKRRQNGRFSEKDKLRLQELIDTREAIQVKYNLVPASDGAEGFVELRKRLDAEVARAQARGKSDADVSVYENLMVGAAEGLAAVNAEIDANYDKEYALIQLITDQAEREASLAALNDKYNADRRAAALEYAALLADVVLPVWEQEDIQKAATDMEVLNQKLREYSAASDSEKPDLLADLNALTSSMDEGAITEYIAMLTQIQSLLDSGMTNDEVQALFPEIDFSKALEQIASIQTFLNGREAELPGLTAMFGEAVPEEVLKIATDLDMTGAQARWDEFALNPGSITTDAVIASLQENENTVRVQPVVDAFIAKYTEIPEGASTAELTPEGLIAYVSTYAEATTGADVSGLTPENVTAMVSAYKELASGTDMSALTPDEITAYISKYLEENEVDTNGLTPDAITAFVVAYEEATGGATTTALSPSDITAMVSKYLEAEGVDASALSPSQIEAIVSSFAEATGCDKSTLMQDFTAYIARYDDTNAVKPQLSVSVGIVGYDLAAYRQFVKNNPVEVHGILKLGEVYEDPSQALDDPNVKFWQDNVEIPVTSVPAEMLTADKVAVLDEDGTLHVLITPEVTGTPEAVANAAAPLTKDTVPTMVFGNYATHDWGFLNDLIGSNVFERMGWLSTELSHYAKNIKGTWMDWRLIGSNVGDYNKRINREFSPETVAALQTYVAEMIAAIQSGQEVSEEDIAHLQTVVNLLGAMDASGTGDGFIAGMTDTLNASGFSTSVDTLVTDLQGAVDTALQGIDASTAGAQIAAGVGEGMANADMTAPAESMAGNTESATNSAFGIQSPARRMVPIGGYVAAGIAEGMQGYSFQSAAASIAGNTQSALSAVLSAATFRPIGVNAMAGLRAGIIAGRSGVISAMRSAARSAVAAAKSELKIHSPSQVFRDEVGVMTMKGLGEGVLRESKEQAKIIRNASRFLTEEAKGASIMPGTTDNRRTYNQQSSVSLTGNTFYIRDEQDVKALAIEIAALTRRQQRGKGLRMA